MSKNNPEAENRLRLQKLVDRTKITTVPPGWEMKQFAIGGLSNVGFSKNHPELLLVISSQGRGVIDCATLELKERDNDDSWEWMDIYELWAMGIGILKDEKIGVSGIHGGGLPLLNKHGDSVTFFATEWPIVDLIFEPKFKSIYYQDDAVDCFRIFHDYELKAYGFSYDGNYFVTATGSEINVYRKKGVK